MICDDCFQDTADQFTSADCPDSMDGDHHPARCLNESEHCRGPVDLWHSGGMHGRSWPRCTFHGEERLNRYENSLERYADSDTIPEWFDESYAGESWD